MVYGRANMSIVGVYISVRQLPARPSPVTLSKSSPRLLRYMYLSKVCRYLGTQNLTRVEVRSMADGSLVVSQVVCCNADAVITLWSQLFEGHNQKKKARAGIDA